MFACLGRGWLVERWLGEFSRSFGSRMDPTRFRKVGSDLLRTHTPPPYYASKFVPG